MWEELVRRWYPQDPFSWDQPGVQAHYELKGNIARAINPKRIGEFGVRAGYSMFAMLHACPDAFGFGVDDNTDQLPWVNEHVWKVLAGHQFALQRTNSHDLRTLPCIFDLLHVDGDHTYEGARADLEFVLGYARTIMVDDYNVDLVRRATDEFVTHHGLEAEVVPDDFRGILLIHTTL